MTVHKRSGSRLPLVLGIGAAAATVVLLGPIAAAVVLLRSTTDAAGPSVAVQVFIAVFVLALAAAGGFATWATTRLVLRLLGRGR